MKCNLLDIHVYNKKKLVLSSKLKFGVVVAFLLWGTSQYMVIKKNYLSDNQFLVLLFFPLHFCSYVWLDILLSFLHDMNTHTHNTFHVIVAYFFFFISWTGFFSPFLCVYLSVCVIASLAPYIHIHTHTL